MNPSVNLYEVLGVSPKATLDEIKTAYRNLAKQHHPDVGGDAKAFDAVTKAYEVLSDEKKREHYDRTGTSPDSPSSIEARATQNLCGLLLSIVQSNMLNIDTVDLVATMKERVQSVQFDMKRKLSDLDKQKKRILSVKKRLKKKNPENDFLSMSLNMAIQEVEKGISIGNEEIEVGAIMGRLLEDYTFDVNKAALMMIDHFASMATGTSSVSY